MAVVRVSWCWDFEALSQAVRVEVVQEEHEVHMPGVAGSTDNMVLAVDSSGNLDHFDGPGVLRQGDQKIVDQHHDMQNEVEDLEGEQNGCPFELGVEVATFEVGNFVFGGIHYQVEIKVLEDHDYWTL